jgi:hypothetical protein
VNGLDLHDDTRIEYYIEDMLHVVLISTDEYAKDGATILFRRFMGFLLKLFQAERERLESFVRNASKK